MCLIFSQHVKIGNVSFMLPHPGLNCLLSATNILFFGCQACALVYNYLMSANIVILTLSFAFPVGITVAQSILEIHGLNSVH